MLHIHRSERADRLASALAEVLREPPADPFAPEVIAVPAKGVERWLTQRLSHVLGASGDGSAGAGQDGVCANIAFPSVTALVADALSVASGVARGDDAWDSARLVWSLLEVIDECAGEDWCSALAGHLGLGREPDPHRRGRRLTAAQHLAGLFSAYGSYRPAMLREWAGGVDADGAGGSLEADIAWQAELWRRLRRHLGVPSPAERLEQACAALRERPQTVDLPKRLSLFGATRLSADQLAVLSALAEHREVHLWISHPSPVLWDTIAREHVARGPVRRRADPTRSLPRHPLLASLGREVRELQLSLATAGSAVDTHHPAGSRPQTLLGRLQDDLARDERPPDAPLGDVAAAGDARVVLAPGDRSVQVHACHGPARQVEVLREVLLGLLEADPSLEPRDVLVMCPDIESYAPLVSATFGLGEEDADGAVGRAVDAADGARGGTGTARHPGRRLRVRLADRSLRRTNPLLDLLAHLLELADGRVTASQVLDLAATPPVRRRFGFDDDDLERLRDWVARSGVRWGLDREHRAPFGLQQVGQNTWQAGLDRILLGAAMAEDELRWLGLALPLDDVDSGDIDLAGRLCELVDRLAATLDALSAERPLSDWLATLEEALELLGDVGTRDSWQLAQARGELTEVAAAAGARAGEVQLSLADVRALLAGRLQGRPTRAGFRTGTLTVCTMVPMRSVPHRVVCLLGLDDGVFPRGAGTDGDDVMARDPGVGERDRRAEDRQLLLDAVLAAQQTLVVLYSGADERTNAPRPPAVPIGEILDVLEATARTPDGSPVRDRLVVRHPLQPFDARNFTVGELGATRSFSFDMSALEGARRAAGGERQPVQPFLAAPLAPVGGREVELRDLISFLEHPVRGFLRQRLGVVVLEGEDEVADALSVELEPLERWQVGDRMLDARLNGADAADCRAAEWRRGMLPPGALGKRVLDDLEQQLEPLVVAGMAARQGPPAAADLAVPLPGDRLLTGTVAGLHGASIVRVVYSRLGPKHRLRAWAQLLALAVGRPGQQWQAVTIGRGKGKGIKRSTLTAPAPDVAARVLGALVELRERGLCEPLPMAVDASHTYALRRELGDAVDDARDAAAKDWLEGFEGAADRHHVLAWGPEASFDVLIDRAIGPVPPGRDPLAGPPSDERSLFGALARMVWGPLIAAERTDVG